MRFICSIFCLIMLISCKYEEKTILRRDFIYSFETDSFSAAYKFSKEKDTVFVKQLFPEYGMIDYFILNKDEKRVINNYLVVLNKAKFEKEYADYSTKDAMSYQFEFDKDKMIYVYNSEVDDVLLLNKFSELLLRMIDRKERSIYWNLDVDFGNLERFIEPEPFPIDDFPN